MGLQDFANMDPDISLQLGKMLQAAFSGGIEGDIPVETGLVVQSVNMTPLSGMPLVDADPARTISFFDDFLTLGVDDTTGDPTGYTLVTDDSGESGLIAGAGGLLQLKVTGVDNHEAYLQAGSEAFSITDSGGDQLWFLARVRMNQHADEAFFIGLAELGAITGGDFLADNTGVPADKDFIGFRTKADASDEVDFAHRVEGGAEQEVADLLTQDDEFHILGFHFDGDSTIRIFVDGNQVNTVATSGATFPDGEGLTPTLGVKTGEGVIKTVDIDYLLCVQER